MRTTKVPLLVAAIALAGCEAAPSSSNGPDAAAVSKAAAAEIVDRDMQIANLTAEVASLKAAAVKRAPTRKISDDAAPRESPIPARRAVAMCYKDYCPCDPPQEGMDTILCDQLQAGDDVATDSMIAGRAGREYRREVRTGDY